MKIKTVSKKKLALSFKGPGWTNLFAEYQGERVYIGDELRFYDVHGPSRLYVPNGHGQARRVAMTVRYVWLNLPRAAKTRMVTYWQAHIVHTALAGVFLVELLDNADATARTCGGTQIVLNGQVIRKMDDMALRDVIAHEFGHAWSYTYDDSIFRNLPGDEYWAPREWEADLAAEQWARLGRLKVSMARMRKWGDEHDALVQKYTGRSGMWILPPLESLDVRPLDPATRV